MAPRVRKSSSSAANAKARQAEALPQETAPATVADQAAGPAGESVPAGIDTAASESGDAAGSARTEPVKPLEDTPTGAMVAEAGTRSVSSMPPEAEASASGTKSENTPESVAGGAGNAASPAGAPSIATDLAKPHSGTGGGIRVTSKTDGFRRGGVAHSTKGLVFPPAEISAEQLEAFLDEPELVVEFL